MGTYRLRRLIIVLLLLLAVAGGLAQTPVEDIVPTSSTSANSKDYSELDKLVIKGRAPKTGYSRSEFGDGWGSSLGCDTRNQVLARDLVQVVTNDGCKVTRGVLNDPYTGKTINFIRGELTSDDVQIDHVVALSNAWQTGAQQLSYIDRVRFANDPLNLLAADGAANQQKSDGDAATWLPPNKAFRCQYVERQVRVKQKYQLWVTPSERAAILRVLAKC